MQLVRSFVILQLFSISFTLTTAQWCVRYKSVVKTRIQWVNGVRLVSNRNFFGSIRYKNEPYVYSTIQTYNAYERYSVCCDGYTKIDDNRCKPVCSPPCPTNSHCMRPDVCACDLQYRDTGGPYDIQCEPICTVECSNNTQCIAPNKCGCKHGYEDNGEGECLPVCKECPENASCLRPEECVCNTGYLDNGFGQCKPECNTTCPENSECTQPDTCSCHQAYEMKENKCWPICEEECPENSECLRPNECVCKEGYKKSLEIVGDKYNFKCTAICDQGCPVNAVCIQHNVCECIKGFKLSQDNVCEPVCENECPLQSTCSEPNQCTCNKGYQMLDQLCQPICEKACPQHSICSEPNKCQCEAGYQLKLSSSYNMYCEPVCQPNCSTNGKCVQPNKCECLNGYEMDEMEVCQPVCSRGCRNGLCFQPENCICLPGYLMGPQQECEPTCSLACQNGSCVEPEICQCYEGFEFKNNSVNVCEPICEPKCINGICVGPNVCICHENYEPTTTNEGELNHSNCEETTTRTEEYEDTTTTLNETDTTYADMMTTTPIYDFPTTNSSSTLKPDHLRHTSSRPLIAADICNNRCQCWQEFDEFGPLIAKKCTQLCVDAFDKPCLDLNQCKCDEAKNYLVCHIADESLGIDDDPLYYMCNLPRLTSTTSQSIDSGISNDMRSVQPEDELKFVWWWVLVLAVLVAICLIASLLYVRYRKVEEPIIEYEL